MPTAKRPTLAALLAPLAGLALASCADGRVSEAERRLGAEQHPQLLAEFGGDYPGGQTRYLAALGERLAAAADLEGTCTFTLVNSDVVNAFAVPGCYIYVTRGLLTIVNSEAELASVLAHEIGHIAADHSERQQKRSIWRSLGVMAIGLITGSDRLNRLASEAATFFTLRYSRSSEYEADDLGLSYLMEVGYDPYAAADMLGALDRYNDYRQGGTGQDDARSIPEWNLTHPLTKNRIERARDTAAELARRPDRLPEKREAYLRQIDGMLFGDDPEQGFVLGRRFAHPVMRISFVAPEGFTLTNSPQAILIEGPNGARGEFAGGPLPPGGLAAYADAMLGEILAGAQARIAGAERPVINGVPALVVAAEVATGDGPVSLALAAFSGDGVAAYHFLIVSQPGQGLPRDLDSLFGSFTFLSPQQVAQLRPRVLTVRTANGGETVRSLAGAMAAERPMDLFLMLNGMRENERLRPGQQVKLVEWAD